MLPLSPRLCFIFASVLSPPLAEMLSATHPIGRKSLSIGKACPPPKGSPLRDDWPRQRADLLLSPFLCARWSCEIILDYTALRTRRSLVLHVSDDQPHHTNALYLSGLRRHVSPYTFVAQRCWRPHFPALKFIPSPSGDTRGPLVESGAKY